MALVGLLTLALLLSVTVLSVRRRRAWFHLPTARTDVLRCRGTHRVILVQLDSDGFAVPGDLQLRDCTVFLSVIVRTLPWGHLREPWLEFGASGATHRQYFETGATGQRIVNLTPVFQGAGLGAAPRVALRGRSLRWEAQGTLSIFEPPPMKDASVLVLAPHPDDAEIAAFGMYANRESWVVTVTAGEKGTAAMPVEMSAQMKGHYTALLRVSDSLSVPQLGKVPLQRRVNLVFPDAALEMMFREPTRTFRLACEDTLKRAELRSQNSNPAFQVAGETCKWNDLVAELRHLIQMARPDIVICPHPLIDAHSDHVYTAVALERALRGISGPAPRLFLYVVHTRGAPTYPFGPSDAVVSLPPTVSEGWVAGALYSHPIDSQLRQLKSLAVSAMHAARRPATSETNTVPLIRRWMREFIAQVSGVRRDPTNLLRRAPRPNEIYYLVDVEELSDLVERLH